MTEPIKEEYHLKSPKGNLMMTFETQAIAEKYRSERNPNLRLFKRTITEEEIKAS